MPNCFGFIILDFDKKHTLLVETPEGYLSFPKGKFEKKKDLTQLDCALRELEEETGITSDMITIVPDIILSEYSKKNICSIQYFVGILKSSNHVNFDPIDAEEIIDVKWHEINKINLLDNLKESRKDVFNELVQLINL